MKITIIGAGYVGLVSGACFAEMGNTVICLDADEERIRGLKEGIIPLYEPGLDRLIEQNAAAKRLYFTTDFPGAARSAEVIFICVGTPPTEGGGADISKVLEAANSIGRHVERYAVVATKSTVPVGTTAKAGEIIRRRISERGAAVEIDMVHNPEFLKEGNAVSDFMGPDRVVVGAESERARETMHRLYAPFLRNEDRVIFMSIPSSELTKYASNVMLATRISLMNEIALLAEKVGADIESVRQGIARDKRIGKYFLYTGAGYGGSCFPKDISSLIHTGKENRIDLKIPQAVNEVNRRQKQVISEKVLRFFQGDVHGKRIAVWGLAFKPETDDVREAPAIETVRILRDCGALLALHDPKALDNARKVLGDESLAFHSDNYEALADADALIVMTEWKEYRSPDWNQVRNLMRGKVVFDGRNLYEPGEMKGCGFRYFGIGHGEAL
ncbi:MAG: UDP-glucose/GDP-mannose dehydrogenase family protein [Candidatus Latescibacter sp.]|nr:UDP-glucose/GDP-mannose dehydrogenase family protein [Candidatus Latescibacter sp.]